MPKNWKLASNSGIQTDQILSNDDEVCIPSLSSILLALKAEKYFMAKVNLEFRQHNLRHIL